MGYGDDIGPDGPAEAEEHHHDAAREALQFLLTRIGSWTEARWDQHLRHEFGDEKADRAIQWIEAMYQVKQYGDQRVSERRRESPRAPSTPKGKER